MTTSHQIGSYSLLIYGSPSGYQTNRSQIQLKDTSNRVVAWVRFNDPGQFFENDYVSGGIIRMHLPSTMFHSFLDVLRNEKPLHIYFIAGRAFFGTASEPIGEGLCIRLNIWCRSLVLQPEQKFIFGSGSRRTCKRRVLGADEFCVEAHAMGRPFGISLDGEVADPRVGIILWNMEKKELGIVPNRAVFLVVSY